MEKKDQVFINRKASLWSWLLDQLFMLILPLASKY